MQHGYLWNKICLPGLDDADAYFGTVNFHVTVGFELYLNGRPDVGGGKQTSRLQHILLDEAGLLTAPQGEWPMLMDDEVWHLEHKPIIFRPDPHPACPEPFRPESSFYLPCVFKNSMDCGARGTAMSGPEMFSFLHALGSLFADCIASDRVFLAAVEKLIAEAWPGTSLSFPELCVMPVAFREGAE